MTESTRPEGDLDLTPATTAPDTAPPRRRWRNRAIVGTVLVALGAVLFQAITSASVFYYNVDEAVAQRAELGDSTFRLQGSVVTERATDASGAMVFDVGFGGERITVRHVGEEPTDLFELGIAVVAEGRWEGDVFESTQLLIKHSEAYVADNGERDGVGDGAEATG
jgi:cytochrome c-type biogenesis protein CcmE